MKFFTTPNSKYIIATLRIVTTEKSELTFLFILYFHGFIINSKDMTLKKLTEEKKKMYDLCIKRFEKAKPTIRFVAQVIGNIVASSPPVPLRILSYRALKKQTRLQDSKGTGRTNAKIELSNEA